MCFQLGANCAATASGHGGHETKKFLRLAPNGRDQIQRSETSQLRDSKYTWELRTETEQHDVHGQRHAIDRVAGDPAEYAPGFVDGIVDDGEPRRGEDQG